MTYLLNSPDNFADEAVRGLVASHPELLVEVPGGVARSTQTPEGGQPALVIGGGSGHYPAFAGWVGPGMGHGGAPCGNIFSSPSASEVYSVVRNAENGGGVILASETTPETSCTSGWPRRSFAMKESTSAS